MSARSWKHASRRGVTLLLCTLLSPAAALAQDDEPIPYDDEPASVRDDDVPPPRELPRRSEPKAKKKTQPPSETRGKRARTRAYEDEADPPDAEVTDAEETASDRRFADEESDPDRARASRKARDDADDAPYAYDAQADDSDGPIDAKEKFRSYGALDDPNTGIGLQLFGGVALLDSSRGGAVNTRPQWGARFTWEFGRVLFSEQDLRDAFFADLAWSYVGFREGTTRVFGDSNLHYFSLAPAWTWFFDGAKSFGLYGQAGGGVAYQFASFHVGTGETPVSGIQPLLQYGVGFKGRPLIADKLRLTFRVELTRFRRGYLDDTLIAGSLGGGF